MSIILDIIGIIFSLPGCEMRKDGAFNKQCDYVPICEGDALLVRSIFDDPNGVIIFALDKEYRYISFTMSHMAVMKCLWNTDIEHGECMLDYIVSETDRARAKSNFDRALAGDSFIVREKYGNSFWEDRYLPIFGDDGLVEGLTVFVLNITQLVETEEKLRNEALEMERLKERELIFNSIGEGLYGVDLDGNCIFINGEALRILGYEEHEVIGKETHLLFHHHHEDGRVYERQDCIIHRSLAMNSKSDEVTWLFKKNGDKFPVRAIATPIKNNCKVTGVVIAFSDISANYEMEMKLKNANHVLKLLATTDPLTGIYNRRYFEETGALLIAESRRTGNELSAAMFDIDFFKKINDKYGHSVGDMVLVMVANTVTDHLRKNDTFARIGGEEFVILLPDTGLKKAAEVAERIRKSVEDAWLDYEGEKINCTVSIGVTCVSEGISNLDDLLRKADDRQYAAKRLGRNRTVTSD